MVGSSHLMLTPPSNCVANDSIHAARAVASAAYLLLLVLGGCRVYDEDALKGSVASVVPAAPRAGNSTTEAAVAGDEAGSSHSPESVVSEASKAKPSPPQAPQTPADERNEPGRADTGPHAPSAADGGSKTPPLDGGQRSTSRDAAAAAAAAAADGGENSQDSAAPTQVDSGTADAGAESGFCSGCDNAAPATPVLSDSGGTGNVTTLGSAMSSGGACGYGATTIAYFAAINGNVQSGDAQAQWQGGRICGQCAAVRVKTEQGWKETLVRIVDRCNDPFCGIALGGAPAKDLMGDRPGRYAGSWRFVSCEEHPEVSDGPPAITVKDGSSQYWSLVHVRNPRHAVTAIDWRNADGTSSGSFTYSTDVENYFSVPEAVHMSGMIHLTIHYRDTSSDEVDLSTSQLASPGAEIALP